MPGLSGRSASELPPGVLREAVEAISATDPRLPISGNVSGARFHYQPTRFAARLGADGLPGEGGILVVAGRGSRANAIVNEINLVSLLCAVTVVGLTLALMVRLRRLVIEPLRALSRTIQRRARGESNVRFVGECDCEIGQVASTLDALDASLAESEIRFAHMAEAIDDVIWLADTGSGRGLRYLSPAYERLFGRSVPSLADAFAGWIAATHPEDRARVTAWAGLTETSPSAEIEYRILRPDGSLRWVRSRAFPILTPDGRMAQVAGITSDVTELKLQAAEMAERVAHAERLLTDLRDSEERIRAILAALPDSLFELSPDYVCLAVHTRNPDLFLVPVESMIGKHAAALLPERVYPTLQAAAEDARREGSVKRIEFSRDHLGRTVHREIRMSWSATGNLIVLLADVTEQKLAENRLRVAEERSRALLNALPDVLFEFSPDLVFVDYHARNAGDLYAPPEAFLGRSLRDFIAPEAVERCVAASAEAKRSGRPAIVEFDFQRGADEVNLEACLTPTDGGNTLAVLRDVTHRHERERRLREARDAAEAATRAKGEFLATMSHEIRTPLNAVIGMSGLLLETPLAAEQREHAETIRLSGEALLVIVNDILDFSKIEAGELVITAQAMSPRRLAEEVGALLVQRASERGNLLRTEVSADVPLEVMGDVVRVRQVLLNLVGNAIKFTRQGEIVLRIGLDAADTGPARVRFEVQDTGPGIHEDLQARIFDAFTQADGSMSRQFGGTGLGLTICKRLVTLMGGEIGLRSRVGNGSTFWFTLPLPEAKQESVAAAPVRKSGPTSLDLDVLVAEDNPVNAKLAVSLLRKLGCRPVVAVNGRKALDALATGHFDLVLMDCQMPELDGLEATRELRRLEGDGPHLPVVALTANAMLGDRERCLEAGMTDYLTKPVRLDDLRAALAPFAAC